MLAYEDIAGRLHNCAHRYENFMFEHWELVNEAWIAVHRMKSVKLAMIAIPWRMIDYMRNENCFRLNRNRNRRDVGKTQIRLTSLHQPINYEGRMLKDVLESKKNFMHDVETRDTIDVIASHTYLTLDERMLLDQRFHKRMSWRDIAKTRSCKMGRIYYIRGCIIRMLQATVTRMNIEVQDVFAR